MVGVLANRIVHVHVGASLVQGLGHKTVPGGDGFSGCLLACACTCVCVLCDSFCVPADLGLCTSDMDQYAYSSQIFLRARPMMIK